MSISQCPHQHILLGGDILKGVTRKTPKTYLFFRDWILALRVIGALSWFPVQCSQSWKTPVFYCCKRSSRLCVYFGRELCLKQQLFLVVLWHDWMLWLEANRMRLAICSNKCCIGSLVVTGNTRGHYRLLFKQLCWSQIQLYLCWTHLESIIRHGHFFWDYCSFSCCVQYTVCLEDPLNTLLTES